MAVLCVKKDKTENRKYVEVYHVLYVYVPLQDVVCVKLYQQACTAALASSDK